MIKKYIKFFLFACICFVIADIFVKADEIDKFIVPSAAQFYDNNNGSLTAVTTDLINNAGDNFYMSSSIHTIPNSSGAAIGFNLNEPLLAGYVYTISVSVGTIGCGETRLSSINRIGVGGGLGNVKTYYQNGGNATIKFSDYQVAGQGYKGISYAFVPSNNGTYILLPYTTANDCSDVNYFYGYTINNLGSADNVSQQDINNSINNQTNIINNSINNAENNIQDAITDSANNTDSNIINSANSTQDSINNGLQTCTKQFKYVLKKGKEFDQNGNLIDNADSYYTEKYYSLSGAKRLTISNTGLSSDSSGFIIIYDSNKNYLDYWGIRDRSFDLPEGASYFRLSTEMTGVSIYEGDGCTSKIDAVNDTLKDDDTKGAQDSAGGFFNDFTTDTHGLTGIITAPLSLIKSITSSSCSPLVIPLPYVDKDLTLPCMGTIYSNYFGSFLSIYQLITFGIVAYWVCVRTFNLVKDFKNPDHDEIEVLDL